MSRFFCRLLLTCASAALSLPVLADAGHQSHSASFGEPGQASARARVVTVTMDDGMRFTPARIVVRRGETIHFVVHNRGQLRHEMVLGRLAELKAHAELMQRFPDMEHQEPNMVSVAAGEKAEFRWRFSRAGTVDFACLVPGHYEAGMRGRLTVKR